MVDELNDEYVENLKKFKSKMTKDAYKRFCYKNDYACACEYTLYKWGNGIGQPSSANQEILIKFFKSLDK